MPCRELVSQVLLTRTDRYEPLRDGLAVIDFGLTGFSRRIEVVVRVGRVAYVLRDETR